MATLFGNRLLEDLSSLVKTYKAVELLKPPILYGSEAEAKILMGSSRSGSRYSAWHLDSPIAGLGRIHQDAGLDRGVPWREYAHFVQLGWRLSLVSYM